MGVAKMRTAGEVARAFLRRAMRSGKDLFRHSVT